MKQNTLNEMPRDYFHLFQRAHIRIICAVIVAILSITSAILFSSNARAAVLPADCSTDTPYNCAMSRKKFDQLVASWCSLANGDKREECSLGFYTFVYTSPSDIKSRAGFATPSYCRIGASTTDAQKANIPDFCYVLAKRNTAYYTATKEIIEECGLAESQDRSCATRIQQQFLHDQNADWADEPGAPKSTNSSRAVNVDDEGAKITFIARVATYIKWLTIGVGVIAVFGLVISGIQYAAAQENPQSVAAAKSRINNIIIGIVIYLTMFGLLQWLIPGGVFSL